jgi:hypothetical protein
VRARVRRTEEFLSWLLVFFPSGTFWHAHTYALLKWYSSGLALSSPLSKANSHLSSSLQRSSLAIALKDFLALD